VCGGVTGLGRLLISARCREKRRRKEKKKREERKEERKIGKSSRRQV
jgi:hypothetical protein